MDKAAQVELAKGVLVVEPAVHKPERLQTDADSVQRLALRF